MSFLMAMIGCSLRGTISSESFKVCLLVLCGFGLHRLDNFITQSGSSYYYEFILYTLLLVTGPIHSTLVRFLFRCCCRPSVSRRSPLSSHMKAFSNVLKRLLIFSALMLLNSTASELITITSQTHYHSRF